jgi:Tfp pilus assembly protein PilX
MKRKASARAQRGASLIMISVMLLAIGLMSLSAFSLSRGQYQLVGNLQYQELAFQQAEAVAATAEQWLAAGSNAQSAGFGTYNGTATPGLYPEGKLAALGLDVKTMAWSNSNSVATNDGRYLIERLAHNSALPGASLQMGQVQTGACRAVDIFRIVSRSAAVRGSSRLIETFIATNGCY